MTNAQQDKLMSRLSEVGSYLPKVVRIDPLPEGAPKGPSGHEAVYEHVLHLLFGTRPLQAASNFPLCPEEYALALLYMAVKWPRLQVFGNLDLVEEEGKTVVRVPPQYCPPAPVLWAMAGMLPLDAKTRVAFSNGRLCFGQPVDPHIADANELLLVFYDEANVVTIYTTEIIG